MYYKNCLLLLLLALVYACHTKAQLPGKWHSVTIDSTRTPMQGRDEGAGCFGFAVGDVTGDGYADMASCQWFYENPGGSLTKNWQRLTLPMALDALLILDVNKDGKEDIIALKCHEQYLLQLQDFSSNNWIVHKIGELPICDHGISTQGYTTGQLIPGGLPEIVLNSGGKEGNIYGISIPENPEEGLWPHFIIAPHTGVEKGMAVGDINRDRRDDLVTGVFLRDSVYQVTWYEHNADQPDAWQSHTVGTTTHKPDRYAIADLNNDSQNDIIVAEGRWPGTAPDASLYWFEQTKSQWVKHRVLTEYSINSLATSDLNGDGNQELIIAEHKGPYKRLQILENDGKGNFKPHIISRGKENHIGARLYDLDNDGDLDLAGFGWDDYKYVHVWINQKQQREGTLKQ